MWFGVGLPIKPKVTSHHPNACCKSLRKTLPSAPLSLSINVKTLFSFWSQEWIYPGFISEPILELLFCTILFFLRDYTVIEKFPSYLFQFFYLFVCFNEGKNITLVNIFSHEIKRKVYVLSFWYALFCHFTFCSVYYLILWNILCFVINL